MYTRRLDKFIANDKRRDWKATERFLWCNIQQYLSRCSCTATRICFICAHWQRFILTCVSGINFEKWSRLRKWRLVALGTSTLPQYRVRKQSYFLLPSTHQTEYLTLNFSRSKSIDVDCRLLDWMGIAGTAIAAIIRDAIIVGPNDNRANFVDRFDVIAWRTNRKYFVRLFNGSIRLKNDIDVIGCSPNGISIGKHKRLCAKYLRIILQISWFLMVFGTVAEHIYVSRLLSGLTCGGIQTAMTMYFSEVSDDSIRGILGTSYQLSRCFGILIAYVLEVYINYIKLSVIMIVVTLMFAVSFFVIPATPQYLLKVGEEEVSSCKWIFFRRKSTSPLSKRSIFRKQEKRSNSILAPMSRTSISKMRFDASNSYRMSQRKMRKSRGQIFVSKLLRFNRYRHEF